MLGVMLFALLTPPFGLRAYLEVRAQEQQQRLPVIAGQLFVQRRDGNADSLVAYFPDHTQRCLSLADAQRSRGFIEENQPRTILEHSRQRYRLTLAAGESPHWRAKVDRGTQRIQSGLGHLALPSRIHPGKWTHARSSSPIIC